MLVKAALEKHTKDNVTVVVVDLRDDERAGASAAAVAADIADQAGGRSAAASAPALPVGGDAALAMSGDGSSLATPEFSLQ